MPTFTFSNVTSLTGSVFSPFTSARNFADWAVTFLTCTIRSNTVDALISASVTGLGVIQVIYWDVVEQLNSGRLIRIGLEDVQARDTTMWAVYPSRRQVPARVRKFVELVRTHLAEVQARECSTRNLQT